MNKKKPLFILVGPTAIGKTKLSIDIAKALNGEIISADSMQIYKYMDIGTAKITEEEKEGVEHYLIDEVMPDTEFSVSDYQRQANAYINQILKKDKLPMIVGGTGLYVNSLIYDLDFTSSVSNWKLRDEYMEKAKEYGNEYIHGELEKIDSVSAKRIHVNDTKRIIRAIEIYKETGTPMSEYYKDFRALNDKFDLVMFGLTMDRDKLYERINKRIDKMIDAGLIDEVKNLLEMGYSENLTSMQGIGYKEVVKYINGEYSLEEAIEILKRESRRYAKRQLTWFRREEQLNWINLDNFSDTGEVTNKIVNYTKDAFKNRFRF